jgi:hypothetical protein
MPGGSLPDDCALGAASTVPAVTQRRWLASRWAYVCDWRSCPACEDEHALLQASDTIPPCMREQRVARDGVGYPSCVGRCVTPLIGRCLHFTFHDRIVSHARQ